MNTPRPLSDALLERYLLGELPPDRLAEVKSRVESDAALGRRLEALRSDDALLSAHPTFAGLSAARAAAAPRRAETPRPGLMERFAALLPAPRFAVPAFASLVLLAVVARQGLRPDVPESDTLVTETAVEPGIRLKGDGGRRNGDLEAGLAIYRKTRTGPELLPPQSPARPGDTLQIFYRSFKAGLHGIVFSVDGSGSVTLHLPEESGGSVPLEEGGLRPLPHAYLLDKAPRHERFYLVTAPAPFAADSVLAAARSELLPDRPLPDSLRSLPAGYRQYSYTLRKEAASARKSRKGAEG